AHILVVDVGALFAIHLDGDEPAIDQFGHYGIGIGFPLHYVAPVAGVISDGKKDGFVLASRFGERLWSPGVPIDKVVGVQQKVGALLMDQPVGVGVRALGSHRLCSGSRRPWYRRLVRWSSVILWNLSSRERSKKQDLRKVFADKSRNRSRSHGQQSS